MRRTMKYVKVEIVWGDFLPIYFCAPMSYYTQDAVNRIRRVDAEEPKFWKEVIIEEFEADDPPYRVTDELAFCDALYAISFVAEVARNYHLDYVEQTKEDEQ